MNAVAGRRRRGHGEARAVPLRPDAAGLLRHRRPRARHGHQRHLGVGELPVDDHRLLRPCVLQRQRPASSALAVHRGVERLAVRGVVPGRTPNASSRWASRTSPTPSRRSREIRRNADRGFTSVTLPERPARHRPAVAVRSRPLGPDHPGLRRHRHGHLAARRPARAGTSRRPGAPSLQLGATLFGQLSLAACAEWLWSGYPVKHPDLKIAMSEGGIGWVPMLLDRLDNIVDRSGYGLGWDERPADVLQRNFWFCTIDDPSTIDTRHRIGVENIMCRGRLPARRRHVARHPARDREVLGPHPRRRAAHDVLRERRQALPPPAPRGCPAAMTVA